MKKRILATLLAIVMVLTMAPAVSAHGKSTKGYTKTAKAEYSVKASSVEAAAGFSFSTTVKIKAKENDALNAARVKITVKAPDGAGEYSLIAAGDKGSFDVAKGYYGVPAGFVLAKDAAVSFAVKGYFKAAGRYTVTYALIDTADGDKILAQKSVKMTVKKSASQYVLKSGCGVMFAAGIEGKLTFSLKTAVQAKNYPSAQIKIKTVASDAANKGTVILTQMLSDKEVNVVSATGYIGASGGFNLTGDMNETYTLAGIFEKAGKYTVTAVLVDLATGAELATKKVVVTVLPQYKLTADKCSSVKTHKTSSFKVVLTGNKKAVDLTNASIKVTLKQLSGDEGEVTLLSGKTDILASGIYGPAAGFALTKGMNQKIPFAATFTEAGKYQFTFTLVDLKKNGEVIDTATVTVTVKEPKEEAKSGKKSSAKKTSCNNKISVSKNKKK